MGFHQEICVKNYEVQWLWAGNWKSLKHWKIDFNHLTAWIVYNLFCLIATFIQQSHQEPVWSSMGLVWGKTYRKPWFYMILHDSIWFYMILYDSSGRQGNNYMKPCWTSLGLRENLHRECGKPLVLTIKWKGASSPKKSSQIIWKHLSIHPKTSRDHLRTITKTIKNHLKKSSKSSKTHLWK